MVQVRDLVIGGGNFAVESSTPNPANDFGMGLELAGAFLEQKMERDADAYNIKAETDLQLFGVEALQKTINEVDNPEQITPKFFETYKAKYDELYQAAPNAVAKDKLARTYEGFRGSFGQRAIMAQAEETQSMRMNNVYDSIEKYQAAALNGTIPYAAAKQGISDAINGAGNFLPASQSAKLKRTAKQETAKLIVANMPDDAKFKAITSATAEIKGGFDAAMQMVHANEGGFAAVDGASGAPAMMGINKRAHEAAYNEVMRINQTQGAEAARAYADKFYKENFWDKNKIGELPENVQTIVMDGVINHWSGFQKQLVEAARNGASPEELIQMRRKEYERLANEPGKNGDYPWRDSADGWENRMDNLEAGLFGKTGTAIDDLDVTDKVRVMQDVQKYAETRMDVEDVIAGRAPYMDPSKRGKAVDMHYQEWIAQRFDGVQPTESDIIQASIDYSAEFKALPDTVKNTYTGMINSGNSNQMLYAADAITKITESNVAVGNEFPEDVQKKAILIQSLNAQGVRSDKIAERVQEVQLMRPEEKKAYDEMYNEFEKKNTDTQYLMKQDGFWTSALPFVGWDKEDVVVPSAMIAAFNNEAKAMMPYYKNVDAARKAAMASVKRSWGVSLINQKPQWVRNAPEERYGIKGLSVEENAKWMRGQIISNFYKQNLRSDTEEELQITIAPSRADASVYTVTIINDEGMLFPMSWKPDPTTEMERIQKEFNVELEKTKEDWVAKKKAAQSPFIGATTRARIGNVPTP